MTRSKSVATIIGFTSSCLVSALILSLNDRLIGTAVGIIALMMFFSGFLFYRAFYDEKSHA